MDKVTEIYPGGNPPEILTVEEAAELLRCAPSTVYAEVRRGRIPFFKVGRCLRLRRSELLSLTGRGRR